AVPDLVVGEAFTKLGYDRRVSPRKDSSVAMTVFRLVDASPELFELRLMARDTYSRARDILAQYDNQSPFSYVDALTSSPWLKPGTPVQSAAYATSRAGG